MAPHPAVDANREERNELRREDYWQRLIEGLDMVEVFATLETQAIRGLIRDGDEAEVQHEFGRTPLVQ